MHQLDALKRYLICPLPDYWCIAKRRRGLVVVYLQRLYHTPFLIASMGSCDPFPISVTILCMIITITFKYSSLGHSSLEPVIKIMALSLQCCPYASKVWKSVATHRTTILHRA